MPKTTAQQVLEGIDLTDKVGRAEECRQAVEQAFVEAGHIIMGLPEFPLRVHADVVYYPDHYEHPDGAEIWNIVREYFKWDKFAVSEHQEETDEQQLMASAG